jgi:hypothetical protein
MILQFKVKNFLSIREEQMLDFTASPDKTYEEYAVVKIKNVRISKLGVIYGPNASGKSNILFALCWLVAFMVGHPSRKNAVGINLIPFLLDKDSRERHSSLGLVCYIGDVRYEYAIELDANKIYKEELYYYPNARRALFYERTWQEEKGCSTIEFGPLLKLSSTQRLFIESNCVPNATVLSAYANSNVERNSELQKVQDYLNVQILPMLNVRSALELFANKVVKLEKEGKSFICDMMGKADFNISDLYIKEENADKPEALKEELFFTHKTPFYTGDLPKTMESEGTMRMYGLSALMYSLIKQDQILLCDELENSLHYDLLTHIVKTFLANSERGQLIFTTHSLLLLDEDYMRRDMVYFANKNESGATEIYRAKDFGLHKDVSILNAYRAGKLGAKPQLGSIFID